MKKLIIVIAMMLSLTSCMKQTSDQLVQEESSTFIGDKKSLEISQKVYADPSRAAALFSNQTTARINPNQFYHTGAQSYNYGVDLMSQGISAQVDIKKLRLGSGQTISWWIASYYWVDRPDGIREKRWVQWGYAFDKNAGFFTGFYVYGGFNFPTGYYIVAPLTINWIDQNVPMNIGDTTTFAIVKKEGDNTFWNCQRYGRTVFEVDLQTKEFSGLYQIMTETRGTDQFTPEIEVYSSKVLHNGEWIPIPGGRADLRAWNIAGINQIPTLPFTGFIVGGRIQTYSYPYPWELWNSPNIIY